MTTAKKKISLLWTLEKGLNISMPPYVRILHFVGSMFVFPFTAT